MLILAKLFYPSLFIPVNIFTILYIVSPLLSADDPKLPCLPAGTLFAFKGQEYWKYDQRSFKPQAGYPRSIAKDWLDCTADFYPRWSMPTSPALGTKLQPDLGGPQMEIESCVCFCHAFRAASSTALNGLLVALLALQGFA